jgi:hypothetical protein
MILLLRSHFRLRLEFSTPMLSSFLSSLITIAHTRPPQKNAQRPRCAVTCHGCVKNVDDQIQLWICGVSNRQEQVSCQLHREDGREVPK